MDLSAALGKRPCSVREELATKIITKTNLHKKGTQLLMFTKFKQIIRKEYKSEYYDKVYTHLTPSTKYTLEPTKSVYKELWSKAIEFIGEDERIADFGCGVGQFAQIAIANDKKYELGVDFSSAAIELAKKRNKNHADCFCVGDLYNKNTYNIKEYDVAVLLEVLEHIKHDMFVLDNIPVGKHIILSVPDKLTKAHVRYFKTLEEAVERYSSKLDIHNQCGVKYKRTRHIWLISGIKKD